MTRSLREMEPKDIVLAALAVETANERRFATLGDLFRDHSPAAAAVFEELRKDELEHRNILEELYRVQWGPLPDVPDEGAVREVVECVDLEDPEALIFDTMTERQALEAARKAEQMAVRMYDRLKEETRSPAAREVFSQLAVMEVDHLARVEIRISRLEKG